MDYYFHQKFNHLIKSKKNRQNICDMIKDHFQNKKSEILMGIRSNNPAKDFFFVPGGRILKNENIETKKIFIRK